VRRTPRVALGIGLALLVITCTDKDLNGPQARGRMGLNLGAFRSPGSAGQAPIPIDSVTVSLTSLTGGNDYDTAFAFGGVPYTGDSLVVGLVVQLKHASETFAMNVIVKGMGYTWYVVSDTVTLVPGSNPTPPLVAKLVGPGSNAGGLFIGPQDSTVVPGLPVFLYASVRDSFESSLTAVPVGFRLQNPALGTVSYPTYLTPVLVPVNPGTKVDTTWLIGETPNHLVDSTQIYIVPRTGGGAPAFIYVASGNGQIGTPSAQLPLPLTALVTDANQIPVGLAKVTWSRTGLGTFVSPTDTVVADSFGFARMTYQLGNGVGTDTITASLVGIFAGPPPSVTFTARADTGLALSFDTTAYMMGKSQLSYFIEVTTRVPVASTLNIQLSRSDSAASGSQQIFGFVGNNLSIAQGGQVACCIQLTGNNVGSATLVARAAGYHDATANVTVTTPKLVVDSSLVAYNGIVSVPAYVYVADSTGASHQTASDLVIRDSSSDTTIATTDSATVTIPAGNFLAVASIAGQKPGSTFVTWRAPNYPPQVTQVSVDTAFLYIYAGSGYAAGLGQTTVDNYMFTPGPVRAPLVVTLISSNPAVFTVPATVTLLPDSSFINFPITGKGLGSANLTARTPGMLVSDSVQLLTVNTPVVQPVVAASVARGVKTQVYVYAEDTLGVRSGNVTAPVTVHLSTTDGNAVWDSTTITMLAGQSLDSVGITFNGTGQFTVTAIATGYTTGSTLTNAAAPPVGVSAVRSAVVPMKVLPVYPDSLRRVKPRALKPPPRPRR
jgi:hypothetical protein